jgi:outer membrane receptor protein involved in Fe transport
MVLRNPDGTISQITELYQNGGAQTSRGVDLGLQYERRTPYGVFTWLTEATYIDVFLSSATPLSPQVNSRGSDEGNLKWKANSRLDWAWKGFDLNTNVTYIDGFRETFVAPGGRRQHWVQQTWFFDGQASYDCTFAVPVEDPPVAGYSKDPASFKKVERGGPPVAPYGLPGWKRLLNNTRITIGCNNVFGEDPPRSLATFNFSGIGYPSTLYDSVGRFVYVSLTKKF